jgi:uncharacterized protein YraI
MRSPLFLAAMAGALFLGACASTPPTPEAQPTNAVPEATSPPASTDTPPAPGPTAAPDVGVPVIATPASGDPAAAANYNTYIFSGPGTDYVVYGAFLGGAQALVTGVSEDGAWWAISVPPAPGGIGWVAGPWVTVTNASGVPTVAAPPVPATTDLVPPGPNDPQATAKVNTYVRAGPGTSFPAYGVAPAGASGRVLGESTDGTYWVVRLNPENVGAGYGWVTASTVQASNTDGVPVIEAPAPPAEVPPSQPPTGSPSATATDYVYVRSGAGTCFLAYGVAAPGASAEVAGKSADSQWWQVKISTQYAPDGLGWVSGAYVTTSNTSGVPVVESPPCSSVPVPPPATYACYLQSQTPADYTTMDPGTTFNMTWVLQNTSPDAWSDGVLQFIQSGSGGDIHTGPDSIQIPSEVPASGSYTAKVPALTPSNAGQYGELWQIQAGGEAVCEFWMIINVGQ